MEMVYCRGCAKEIHHTAMACPACGASQAGPSATKTERNVFTLIALGFVYTIGIWLTLMFSLGILAGAFDPGNAAARGEQMGQMLGGPFLLATIGLVAVLTVVGKLPGTAKPAGATRS